MSSITLRYAARCEAAGRDHNEDNFLLDYNLNDNQWGFTTDEVIPLKGNGSILLVCDGMGGMNAGEVASAVAVQTIKEWFDHAKLTPQVTASPQTIKDYIYNAIQAADAAIKADEEAHPEHDGMGSTIVLAWIINGKVYVGWCGDSRAYRYNPKTGLERLSHDHSYVQELVDAGKLTEELAFDHPNSNIITRSLGDPRGKAKPDVKEYDLYRNDIILLCSDGLCGCLRDNEIEAVIAQNSSSMMACRDALWEADEAAGWHDNVTITLAQVVEGGAEAPLPISQSKAILIQKNKTLKAVLAGVVCILLLGVGLACWFLFLRKPNQPEPGNQPVAEQRTDSMPAETAPEKVAATPKTTASPQKTAPAQKPAPAPATPAAPAAPADTEKTDSVPQTNRLTPVNPTPQAPALTPVKKDSAVQKDTLKNGKVLELKQVSDTVVTAVKK